ncbi:MAG TPA: diguanylate cyclase [Longimicrobiales bacterium]|jgi:diguanylate cyclase (GGDEF)-like protein/PAS domain S-box-containing protein
MRKILLVEDDVIVARDLRLSLEALGYAVPGEALNAREGLRAARELRPDLGLIDIGLPGDLDGIDLARAVRTELSLPVVFVTGRSDEATLARVRASGSYGIVTKPFSEDGLATTLSIALARARKERHLENRARHYRTIYEESVAGLAQFSGNGRLIDANDAFARDLGYESPAQLRGRAASGIWVSEQVLRAFVLTVRSAGRVSDHEAELKRRDGSTVWMLCNAAWVESTVQADRSRILGCFFNLSRRKRVEEALRALAYSDPLTGLPNRRLLELRGAQVLEEATRREEWAAFLYMDLVGFKAVNDRIGHTAGDAVLVRLARRLDATRRGVDVAARLGGDEFGVLLGGMSDAHSAYVTAERFLASLGPVYDVDAAEVHVAVRAGLAVFPDHALTLDALIAAADAALAEATILGGRQMVVARPDGRERHPGPAPPPLTRPPSHRITDAHPRTG